MPDSPRPRSSAGPAAAVFLAILLAAGAYLGLTTSGRKALESAMPGVAALLGEKPSAPASSKYDLRNVIGYYESGGASPRILVIKGQVANLSGGKGRHPVQPRSGQHRRDPGAKAVYAGTCCPRTSEGAGSLGDSPGEPVGEWLRT